MKNEEFNSSSAIYIQPIKEIGITPIVSSKPFAVCCFFVPLIGKVKFFLGYFVGKVYICSRNPWNGV